MLHRNTTARHLECPVCEKDHSLTWERARIVRAQSKRSIQLRHTNWVRKLIKTTISGVCTAII